MRSYALFFLIATFAQSLLFGLLMGGTLFLLRPDLGTLAVVPPVLTMVLSTLVPMLLFNILFLVIIARWSRRGDGLRRSLKLAGAAYGAVFFLMLTAIQLAFGSPLGTWPGADTTDMVILYGMISLACGVIAGEAAERFIVP